MKILAVNPGSTSTKIAVYEDETPRLVLNIRHSVEELSQFPSIIDQFEFRKKLVLEALDNNGIPFEFDAIVGRGGLLKPIPGGVYVVNDAMLDDIAHAMRSQACNEGCQLASAQAALLPGCQAFIADPGVVDELDEIARITGSPLMPRITIWPEPARHRPEICCRAQHPIRKLEPGYLPSGWRHFCGDTLQGACRRREQCTGR